MHCDELEDVEAPGGNRVSRRSALESFARFEPIMSVIVLWLLAFSLLGGGEQEGLSRTAENARPGLEVVSARTPSEVEPARYDASKELRVAIAKHTTDNRLNPVVVRLRGPWSFGVTRAESVAGALGKPARQGAGYLVYDFAKDKVRLTLLFSASRLDTLVLEPHVCPGQPDEYDWGLSEEQRAYLQLEPSEAPANGCNILAAGESSTYYLACPLPTQPSEVFVKAVYVQRITKDVLNPMFVRGLGPVEQAQSGLQVPPDLRDTDYSRLLDHYDLSVLLKEKAVGANHSSVQFLRFEMGRVQLEAGKPFEGRKVMRSAAGALAAPLGSNHPDLIAMQSWFSDLDLRR